MGYTSFYIGALACERQYAMKGEVGRFLVCGNQDVPMNDDEIKNVHAYLMEEWKINEKPGPTGPRGLRGLRGLSGPVGKVGKAGENASYYSQYFQYNMTEWDIDFKPNFWIDGHDIQENNPFKVLNMHDHRYDTMRLFHHLRVLQKELILLLDDIHYH